MVVMTRNGYKRLSNSLSSVGSENDVIQKNDFPPWCSLGRVYERRIPQKVSTRELKSSYPLRENVWEYLNGRTQYSKRNVKKISKFKPIDKKGGKLKVFILFSIIGFAILYLVFAEKLSAEELRSLLTKTKLITLPIQNQAKVDEECCYRMKYLVTILSRSENMLRATLRMRRTMLTSQSLGTATNNRNAIGSYEYIAGASAVRGSDTSEWGSRVALWGVVPLWRAAPPPDTVLALRKPTPSDCWPFSGSRGEIEIYLARESQVNALSLEHIQPDTARSAPKDFTVYGILGNGTWIKAADGTYRYNKPAKQYYSLDNRNVPLKRIVFRVLSNHGNSKYTCVYRVHLYGNKMNNKYSV